MFLFLSLNKCRTELPELLNISFQHQYRFVYRAIQKHLERFIAEQNSSKVGTDIPMLCKLLYSFVSPLFDELIRRDEPVSS